MIISQQNKLSSGFSLIELMLAIFVFALISGMAYKAVASLGQYQRSLEEEQQALKQWQVMMHNWVADMQQATEVSPIGISDNAISELETKVFASGELEISGGGRSVQYYLESDRFQRNTMPIFLGSGSKLSTSLSVIDVSVQMLEIDSSPKKVYSLQVNHPEWGKINRISVLQNIVGKDDDTVRKTILNDNLLVGALGAVIPENTAGAVVTSDGEDQSVNNTSAISIDDSLADYFH